MSELLTALVAASKAGFDAPKCTGCSGRGWYAGHSRHGEGVDDGAIRACQNCHATGLDASDPRLISAQACLWLLERGYTISPDEVAAEKGTVGNSVSAERWLFRWRRGPSEDCYEKHDGTPKGLATALLRLVARVGGAA